MPAWFLDEWHDGSVTGTFNSMLITKAFALVPTQNDTMTLSFKQTFRYFAGTNVAVR